MLIAKKHYAVNWVDGMKLTQQHFLETDLHVQDIVRDTTSLPLTNYNYGLLPPFEKAALSNEIQILEKIGNSIEVKLLSCNAVTAGGYRVVITSEVDNKMSVSLQVDDQLDANEHPEYYAVLTVHPFERTPLGELTPGESPIRHPYTDARYSLEMRQTSKMMAEKLGGYFLIIGRIIYTNGGYQVDETFIPPCATMESHPQLVLYYKDFGWILSQLQSNSLKIIRQVYDRQKSAPVARNIQQLCMKILDYLASALFTYNNLDSQRPPIFVIGHFSSLASLIYSYLYCLPAQDKEEVLEYFYEWSDIRPSTFELLLRQLSELKYQHHNIGTAMLQTEKFARAMENLWEKLSGLENIGQRKENIVVYEETVPTPSLGRPEERRRSLLD